MKKLWVLGLAGFLFACDNNGSSTESKLDSLGEKIERKAEQLADSVEEKGERLKEKIENRLDKDSNDRKKDTVKTK
jgi:ABC-type hemin transport system substrate-binding protein